MIITFLSAYYDSNINIIDQPKVSKIINTLKSFYLGYRYELFEEQVLNRFHFSDTDWTYFLQFEILKVNPYHKGN
jgi:hypothetical protein